MKRQRQPLQFILLFFLVSFQHTPSSAQRPFDPFHTYPAIDLRADFQFLRQKLEQKHPQLYQYTPQKAFNQYADSLFDSIKTPMTETEFFNLVTLLHSTIKDGHTMFLPSEAATNYFNSASKFFPFYILVQGNQLFVSMNCSTDSLIKDGAVIRSINGLPAASLLRELCRRQIRDGNNETYPAWILSNYFKEYYGFSFGHPDSFSITYANPGGDAQTTQVAAMEKDSIRLNRQRRYGSRLPATNQGITFLIDGSIATLSIKSFDRQVLKSQYHQDFTAAIKNAFNQIRLQQVQYLILDLRDNQGGDFGPGRLLLTYLLNEPIDWLPGSNQAVRLEPLADHYTGKLYLLLNGGSFSNSGIVSSYLQLAQRAIIIGEESGGNRTLISGEPVDLVLPTTKLAVQISTKKYAIRTATNDGHGVLPDYLIVPGIGDIIMGKDPVKQKALDLIAGGN